MNNTNMDIACLPYDLDTLVMIEMDYTTVVSFGLTCKRYARIVSSNKFWVTKCCHDFPDIPFEDKLLVYNPQQEARQRYIHLLSQETSDVCIGSVRFLPLSECLKRSATLNRKDLVTSIIAKDPFIRRWPLLSGYIKGHHWKEVTELLDEGVYSTKKVLRRLGKSFVMECLPFVDCLLSDDCGHEFLTGLAIGGHLDMELFNILTQRYPILEEYALETYDEHMIYGYALRGDLDKIKEIIERHGDTDEVIPLMFPIHAALTKRTIPQEELKTLEGKYWKDRFREKRQKRVFKYCLDLIQDNKYIMMTLSNEGLPVVSIDFPLLVQTAAQKGWLDLDNRMIDMVKARRDLWIRCDRASSTGLLVGAAHGISTCPLELIKFVCCDASSPLQMCTVNLRLGYTIDEKLIEYIGTITDYIDRRKSLKLLLQGDSKGKDFIDNMMKLHTNGLGLNLDFRYNLIARLKRGFPLEERHLTYIESHVCLNDRSIQSVYRKVLQDKRSLRALSILVDAAKGETKGVLLERLTTMAYLRRDIEAFHLLLVEMKRVGIRYQRVSDPDFVRVYDAL